MATPLSVATPLVAVVAVPTDVPSSVKLTTCPEMGLPVTFDVIVATRVAVPPKLAVPETDVSVVAAGLTTRLPEPELDP